MASTISNVVVTSPSDSKTLVLRQKVPDVKTLLSGLQLNPLPPSKTRDGTIAHAPKRNTRLSLEEKKQALANALRYFPSEHHEMLSAEFAKELQEYGHIYMYRFLPEEDLRAFSLDEIPARTKQGAAIIHMILNNLDKAVAQFPQELITYGGNGQVFSNWAQFWITLNYLSTMEDDQTLVMYSGHPMGLFPSKPSNPRMIITNGMVIPNYSSKEEYDKLFALGVTMYGQMTAGSYCYIGPQGIVHGTTLTVLNAGRLYMDTDDLSGKVFVTSGLGGMSGAQAKAAVVCGCVGVIAEVSYEALKKRYDQGWVCEMIEDVEELMRRIREARKKRESTSIGFHGNAVTLWERLYKEYKETGELLVDLGSDQTSCHDPFGGGYYPVQLNFEEANKMIAEDPTKFKDLVQESLRRQVAAINSLSDVGLHFWDYGNAFLLEARRAGADVTKKTADGKEIESGIEFRYDSYVQKIMGDIFSLGFGPFRWVCTSGDPTDLRKTDKIATEVLNEIIKKGVPERIVQQYNDNLRWLSEAEKHKMVVGSQARILYSDQEGRVKIALAFNNAVKNGIIKSPIVISRDHHDVSGTDSPFRETSNVTDGSAYTADMAVQNCIGDAFRGATWVALHNGGGCGWGEVINGGFGLVLDGSDDAAAKAESMLNWDVSNGVARRAWSGNKNAQDTIKRTMEAHPDGKLKVTVPNTVEDYSILDKALKED